MRMGNKNSTRGLVRRAAMALVIIVPALVLAFAPSADAGKKREGQSKLKTSPKDLRMIELGRRLFYDKAISQTGTQACVDCHDPAHGFSDKRRFSQDERGPSPRHSQPILDTLDNPSTHWDGEFDTVEDAIEARIGRPLVQQYYGVDMPITPTTPSRGTPGRARPSTRPPSSGGGPIAGGSPTSPLPTPPAIPNRRLGRPGSTSGLSAVVAERLQDGKRYAEAFKSTFGSREVTISKIAEAMAAYCHSIQSTEAPYDRYVKGDNDAISASAKRGLELFKGKAGCAQCHSMKGEHALFTDYKFHNTGIAWERTTKDRAPKDFGRKRFTGSDEDDRSFKTATLRDVTRRGPYMHDGRFTTLRDVVLYYKRGGSQDKQQDERIKGFDASEQEVDDLVAFLGTLEGSERPGLAKTAWSIRPKQQRLRFVSPSGKLLKGLPVTLTPRGDFILDKGMSPEDVSRDPISLEVERADGYLQFDTPLWTHTQVSIDGGLVNAAIPLVPDTVKSTKITVPVEGHLILDVIASKEAFTPEILQAANAHVLAPAQPVRRAGGAVVAPVAPLKMQLRRKSLTRIGDKVMARYEGWIPATFKNARLYLQATQGFRANDPNTLSFIANPEAKAPVRLDLTK